MKKKIINLNEELDMRNATFDNRTSMEHFFNLVLISFLCF